MTTRFRRTEPRSRVVLLRRGGRFVGVWPLTLRGEPCDAVEASAVPADDAAAANGSTPAELVNAARFELHERQLRANPAAVLLMRFRIGPRGLVRAVPPASYEPLRMPAADGAAVLTLEQIEARTGAPRRWLKAVWLDGYGYFLPDPERTV